MYLFFSSCFMIKVLMSSRKIGANGAFSFAGFISNGHLRHIPRLCKYWSGSGGWEDREVIQTEPFFIFSVSSSLILVLNFHHLHLHGSARQYLWMNGYGKCRLRPQSTIDKGGRRTKMRHSTPYLPTTMQIERGKQGNAGSGNARPNSADMVFVFAAQLAFDIPVAERGWPAFP